MGKIDLEYIKSLPLTTNKIEVSIDKEAFFSKYAIVSYHSNNANHKCLAYEQLSELPCLSVTGIWAKWNDSHYSTRFFVLTNKGSEREIADSIRDSGDYCACADDLNGYADNLQKRVFASLAINSLGKESKGNMTYNNGALYISDSKNFNMYRKKREELVCLKIEINEYMNLTASTTSFSNPRSLAELNKEKYSRCIFKVSNLIEGDSWDGFTLKPVIIKRNSKVDDNELKNLYIQKKLSNKKNNVPYWPFDKDNYRHGKLFAISQVVESVNEAFAGVIEINFCDFKVLHFDEYKPGKEMLAFMQNYLTGRSLYFEDPFCTAYSKELIESFKSEAQELMEGKLVFPPKANGNEMIVRLCSPDKFESEQTKYAKSLSRMPYSGNALQHIEFSEKSKIETSMVRRILIELIVKDSLIRLEMSQEHSNMVNDWTFYRYKIKDSYVHGASMNVDANGSMSFHEYGLSQNILGEDFKEFAQKYLKYPDYERIRGNSGEYLAMEKNGNVYLIVDTKEIPILDVTLIDEGYNKIVNEGEPISMFKRKDVKHDYLRGYIGFHLWKSEGLNGEDDGSYSYISGYKSDFKMMSNDKMDKMPRARRIFILHSDNLKAVETDIQEIEAMLKFGYGRWDELMTYPFPFKYLQEYLDDACLKAFSCHWNIY